MLISYGEQISPMQFVYAFGFMPKDLEITDLLVPMRAEKPLHLRINREAPLGLLGRGILLCRF